MYVCIHYPRPCQCKLHVNAVVIPASRGTTGFIPAYARNLHAFDTDHYTNNFRDSTRAYSTHAYSRAAIKLCYNETWKISKCYRVSTRQTERLVLSHSPLCFVCSHTGSISTFWEMRPKRTKRNKNVNREILPQAENNRAASTKWANSTIWKKPSASSSPQSSNVWGCRWNTASEYGRRLLRQLRVIVASLRVARPPFLDQLPHNWPNINIFIEGKKKPLLTYLTCRKFVLPQLLAIQRVALWRKNLTDNILHASLFFLVSEAWCSHAREVG